MPHIRHAQQQPRSGAHPLLQFRQRPPRIDQVFQHIGHDHQVIIRPSDLLQTGLERDIPDLLQQARRLRRRLCIRFHAIATLGQPGIQQSLTQPTISATDVQRDPMTTIRAQKLGQFLPVGAEVSGTHRLTIRFGSARRSDIAAPALRHPPHIQQSVPAAAAHSVPVSRRFRRHDR